MRNLRALISVLTISLVPLFACGGDAPPPATPPMRSAAPPLTQSTAPLTNLPPAPQWDPQAYHTAIDEVLESMLSTDPVWATAVGDHRFDDAWPDISKDGETRLNEDRRVRAQGLRTIALTAPEIARDQAITAAGTDRPQLDAVILADRLEGSREYDLAVKPFEKDPSAVLMMIGGGINRILAHPYSPLQTRLDALSTRLSKVPALMATARARLDHPRRAGLENTQIVAEGLVRLLQGPAMKPATKDINNDAALAKRLAANADAAQKAIDAYAKDVAKTFPAEKADLQPIGTEAWAKIAKLTEGVNESPADVRRMGEAETARLQGELDDLIKKSGKPGETRAAFLARMEADQPKPETIIAEYKDSATRVETWLKQNQYATIPWEKAKLQVVPAPPHMRGIGLASMNVAGVLDSISDADFEVNTPDASMPAARQKALLAFHARGAMDAISMHEGLPGHYLQALNLRQSPSKVRKLIWTSTSGEGWAHYCEEAMLDAGFGKDRDVVKARAFYLRFALQRSVRAQIDVGENDGSLTMDAAADKLVKDALLAPDAAKIEARRAMVRPVNMFSYMYGKIAIKKLRDAVKQRDGESYSMQKFHDRFLSLGAIPVVYAASVGFGVR